MEFHTSVQVSAVDRVLAAALATFSMFVVGYTATRVYLDSPSSQALATESDVIPHQAEMWSGLGR